MHVSTLNGDSSFTQVHFHHLLSIFHFVLRMYFITNILINKPWLRREIMYQGDEIRFQTDENIPVYGSAMTELFPANAFNSRKRSRDSSFCYPNAPVMNPNAFEFLNEDIIGSQIYQQQYEIDRFITSHVSNIHSFITFVIICSILIEN